MRGYVQGTHCRTLSSHEQKIRLNKVPWSAENSADRDAVYASLAPGRACALGVYRADWGILTLCARTTHTRMT